MADPGAAGRSAELEGQDLPLNYVAPDEGDFLLDEVDRRVDDVCTGKRKLAKYSSVDEYFGYLDKAFAERARGTSQQTTGP